MTHAERRARIVEIARAEKGAGRVEEYWKDVLGPSWVGPHPQHWCGAFALWCLHQAGIAHDVRWVVGKGFLYHLHTKDPWRAQAGDIVYFDKPYQHHAIFADRIGATIDTIDGNQPGVTERLRHLTGGIAVFDITPLLPAETPTDPCPPPEEGPNA
ncbi:MAG TPA: CHAP domain-containing protein [Candidatus Acidoferrum sp.]|nr:CHAP domain-containing protein [Candidatus Acidoferrum sp.]